jgi:non-ribosomal peptide synthetase component F
VAVIDADGAHSYQWLARASDRAARALAGRDEPVVLARGSSAAFVAALLGCRRAGVACTVAEPFAVADGVTVVDAGALIRGDDAPSVVPPSPPDPGRDWAVERYGIGPADRVTVLSGHPGLLMAAVTTAAYAGATLVLPPEPFTRDVTALAARLRADAITVLYATPPILRALAARIIEPLPALRHVFVENAGELIAPDLDAFRGLCATSRYVSVYRTGPDGRPTAVYAVPPDWEQRTAPLRVPLGAELPDASVRLLLGSGQVAAIGEVGELWSGGEPTGDLGRRWADGTLEFVGRGRSDLERK